MHYSKLLQSAALLCLGIGVLIVAGCEKDGSIKIINRTSYPVYAGIATTEYTIGEGNSRTIDVSTPTSSVFNPDVEKKVDLHLIGETFMIYDDYLEEYVEQTTVVVKPGKTTKVYIDPNRASVKVRNLTDSLITQIQVERHEIQNTYTSTYDVNIASNSEWFQTIPYATSNNQFFIIVRVLFSDGTEYLYGNTQTILGKDEQFMVEILPPGKL